MLELMKNLKEHIKLNFSSFVDFCDHPPPLACNPLKSIKLKGLNGQNDSQESDPKPREILDQLLKIMSHGDDTLGIFPTTLSEKEHGGLRPQ